MQPEEPRQAHWCTKRKRLVRGALCHNRSQPSLPTLSSSLPCHKTAQPQTAASTLIWVPATPPRHACCSSCCSRKPSTLSAPFTCSLCPRPTPCTATALQPAPAPGTPAAAWLACPSPGPTPCAATALQPAPAPGAPAPPDLRPAPAPGPPCAPPAPPAQTRGFQVRFSS